MNTVRREQRHRDTVLCGTSHSALWDKPLFIMGQATEE